MAISKRRYRAGIYWYIDLGTDGRSDPVYVKQESSKADGNYWCSLDQIDGDEVLRGGKPEYRTRAVLGFGFSAPLEAPQGSHTAILVADLHTGTEQIFFVRSIVPRLNGQWERQVRVELAHDSIATATYSDGYYYAD